jgi:diguanylate cyclase (GGDEF)-like protein/PAS domain S-box-containing protein
MSSRGQQLRKAFFAGLALFLLSTLALSAYSLWRLRTEAIADSLQVAAVHARSFENFLTQSLRVTEQAAINAAPVATDSASLKRLEHTLVATLRQTPFLRSLSLQDPAGRIIASSNPGNIGVRVPTQDYLPLADVEKEILRIGQPWSGRDFSNGHVSTPENPSLADAQGFIPLTRSFAVGGQALTLLIAINPDYFVNNFSEAVGHETGLVEVLRYDGTLLMGTGLDVRVGATYKQLVSDLQLGTVESGTFEQPPGENAAALTAFRASRLYPFVVITRLNRDQALQQWNTEAKTLMSVLAPTLLAIALLATAFYRRQMEAVTHRAEAERQLRINASVFDASSESIVITDSNANILSVNAAFTRITGYTEAEVLGRNPRLLASGLHGKPFYAAMWDQLLATGQWRGEVTNRRKDGSRFDAYLSISISRDSHGHLQHYVGVIADITERKQARLARDEALNRLNRIASRVPGVLFEFRLRPDGSTAFPYASDAMVAMYGNRISPDDVAADASRVFALIHPDDLEMVAASIQKSAAELTPWHQEYRLIPEDGRQRWLLGSSIPEREADGSVLWHGIVSDITERKHSEAEAMELNRDFVSFLENTSDFIYFKDKDSRFRFASQTLAHITGHAHWRDMTGKHDLEVFPPETAKIYYEEELPIFQGGKPLINQVDPYLDAAGSRGWVSTSKWPLFDPDGNVEGLFGISRDVTVHKLNEEKLELAASVFHNSREGITITGTDGTIIDVNEAFTQITGYSRAEVLGQNPRMLSSGRHNAAHYANMWQCLISKGHWYGEIWNRRKNGEVYAEMLTITTVRDPQGEPKHYVALFSDITTAKEHEQQLEHIAHYDALTSLPNRVLLADRLKQAMLQVQRRAQRLAVVYLDLDGFKAVNDLHGHEAGDHLLMALAVRMKAALREGDTLARIGGDEFVAVLVDLVDATESMPMLNRLLAAASEPVYWNTAVLQVSASLGVTLYPQEGDEELDADQLQRQADQAMYQAKVSGKSCYHFFDATHDRNVRDHHESLERIRCALTAGEMVLHYQPKVNMRTGEVIGVEALIRWQHPQRGLLAPGLFLPGIENHALAVELDEWVIHTVLTQIQSWQDAGLQLPVSINVGARLLQRQDFVQRIQTMLAAHPGVDPRNVELEVLETSALMDIDRVSWSIQECRDIGVKFSLDDFGTGYSSLAYVKRLPVSQLKIDQSFVRDMLVDNDDLAILRAVMGLAAAFQQGVLAEGVETAEQGIALMQLGCDFAQGYFISRPMPAHDIPAWVSSWKVDATWLTPSAPVPAQASFQGTFINKIGL